MKIQLEYDTIAHYTKYQVSSENRAWQTNWQQLSSVLAFSIFEIISYWYILKDKAPVWHHTPFHSPWKELLLGSLFYVNILLYNVATTQQFPYFEYSLNINLLAVWLQVISNTCATILAGRVQAIRKQSNCRRDKISQFPPNPFWIHITLTS